MHNQRLSSSWQISRDMELPPTYEEAAPAYDQSFGNIKDEKAPQRFSIREEVGASRSQHVAALVEKVLPQIRDRAQAGLAKSTLLLLPSGQDAVRRGTLVGWCDDKSPIPIQLEGRLDSLEFWTQQEALMLLRQQLFDSLYGLPASRLTAETDLPSKQPAPRKSSIFNRKQGKAQQEPPKVTEPARSPVTVEVMLDEVNFRGENEFGLYETLQGKAVLVRVEVR